MKVLFLVPYPINEAPSQRFRFEQYLPLLKQRNITISVQSFIAAGKTNVLYGNSTLQKFLLLLGGFTKRFLVLFQAASYDIIFIHREVTPAGPPVFEWILVHLLRKKIIYDFDDAIWLTDKKDESVIEKAIRWRSKVASICAWSYKVSCGNEYLATFARKHAVDVRLIPTTIDTEHQHNPALFSLVKNSNVIVGWTGSHSTLKYLEEIEQALQEIELKYPQVRFLVIADKPANLALKNLSFIPWSAASEISDLAQIDIGIMPLPNDEWALGKCGFKALQYLALEKPAIVSPIGVNLSIVQDGVNGLFAESTQAWTLQLGKLIEQETLRKSMGKEGRKTVEAHYSVRAISEDFLSLFAE